MTHRRMTFMMNTQRKDTRMNDSRNDTWKEYNHEHDT